MKNKRYSKWGREWGDYRVHKRSVIGDVSLIEFIGRYPYCLNIGYSAGRGIMGWGNAYLNGVLLNRSNTCFFFF